MSGQLHVRLHTTLLTLPCAGLLADYDEAYYASNLRFGETVLSDDGKRKFVLLSTLQKDVDRFWVMRQEPDWEWKYVKAKNDDVVVLLVGIPWWKRIDGAWLCGCCH